MFIDVVSIKLIAGRGGDGLVSFRREKYVARGGPNGGDGGDGGSIFFKASKDEYDLNQFRFKKIIKASDGQAGGSSHKKGRSGQDVIIKVPLGTVIYVDNEIVADLNSNNQIALLAQGGRGGFGNAHFKSSTRKVPLIADKGLKGQSLEIRCELKLLAEVGLVGLPNSGKSTFLKVTTNANPKIGAYAFTTLEPHLGVTKNQCLIADIPGLIEGAAEGKGLGHKFLRHIERNLVLLHLIDCQSSDVALAYRQILTEIEKYNAELLKLPQLVALTKIDTLNNDQAKLDDQIKKLKAVVGKDKAVYAISSVANINLENLLKDLKQAIVKQRNLIKKSAPKDNIPVFKIEEDNSFLVDKKKNQFIIKGSKIETFAAKTNFDDFHSRQRLRDIMSKLGITKQLLAMDYKDQEIIFGDQNIGKLYLYETNN